MDDYKIIVEEQHQTVMAHYEVQERPAEGYQSEAQLESAFIKLLMEQGYEYLRNVTSSTALIHNLRVQLEKLNNYQFTEAMLETLSIVAYRQPVTRSQVEDIRGVGCANQISRLVEYGLIYESDRLNAPGRPFLFATTDEFLRLFNLSSLDDLPEVSEDLLGQMKLEVENETPGQTENKDTDENNEEDEIIEEVSKNGD